MLLLHWRVVAQKRLGYFNPSKRLFFLVGRDDQSIGDSRLAVQGLAGVMVTPVTTWRTVISAYPPLAGTTNPVAHPRGISLKHGCKSNDRNDGVAIGPADINPTAPDRDHPL
jgi:hypothetical protein